MKTSIFFRSLVTSVLLSSFLFTNAQHQEYYPDPDTAIQHRLDEGQDLNFGLLMHWGAYSQWGIVESWSICPEDEGWTQRHGHGSENYFTYLNNYENLL